MNSSVRVLCLRNIEVFTEPQTLYLYVSLLKDPSSEVREAATAYLCNTERVDHIVAPMIKDKEKDVRSVIITAIITSNEKLHERKLNNFFKSDDNTVLKILQEADKYFDNRSVPSLKMLAENTRNLQIRQKANEILKQIKRQPEGRWRHK